MGVTKVMSVDSIEEEQMVLAMAAADTSARTPSGRQDEFELYLNAD